MTATNQHLSRNLWTSWVGYAVRITISFFFVPYIASILGDARYGVWVIVFQTINYFMLLDFGLEKALLRFVSKHLDRPGFDSINRILNTSFNIYLIAGTLIIIGAWLTATFLFGVFKVDDPSMLAEGSRALMIIGLYIGIRFFLLPFAGSLGAFQRFDISNGLYMTEDVVRTVLMVLVLSAGYGLVPLALVILGTSLVRQMAAIVVLKRLHPEVAFRPAMADRATARELFDYSKVTFGITLAWLIIFNTDAVLLGLTVSTAAAGVYAPGAQLMLYLRNAVNVIASPITAAVSRLEAADDWDAIRRLYLKGIRYTSFLSFLMATGVILYARPFVALWLPPEFAASAEVMQILAVSTAFFVPQIVGNAVLFGIDSHSSLLKVLVLEALTKIILSLVLIPHYGLLGMAYAAAIPQLLLYVSYYPFLMGRAVSVSPILIMMTSLRSGLLAMAVSIPACAVTRYLISPDNWFAFAVDVGLVAVSGLSVAWFILTPEDRAKVRPRLTGRT